MTIVSNHSLIEITPCMKAVQYLYHFGQILLKKKMYFCFGLVLIIYRRLPTFSKSYVLTFFVASHIYFSVDELPTNSHNYFFLKRTPCFYFWVRFPHLHPSIVGSFNISTLGMENLLTYDL